MWALSCVCRLPDCLRVRRYGSVPSSSRGRPFLDFSGVYSSSSGGSVERKKSCRVRSGPVRQKLTWTWTRTSSGQSRGSLPDWRRPRWKPWRSSRRGEAHDFFRLSWSNWGAETQEVMSLHPQALNAANHRGQSEETDGPGQSQRSGWGCTDVETCVCVCELTLAEVVSEDLPGLQGVTAHKNFNKTR